MDKKTELEMGKYIPNVSLSSMILSSRIEKKRRENLEKTMNVISSDIKKMSKEARAKKRAAQKAKFYRKAYTKGLRIE